MASISTALLGPGEPAEIPGLILCPPRPPPAAQVLREWGEGSGAKVKAGPTGPAPLRGGWGRGGVPTPCGTVRGPAATGETLWEQRNGREPGQCFPCPLRHWGIYWAPRPNPLPSEPPFCCTEPKPCLYTPTQGPTSTPHTLRPPPTALGLNPTHTPSPRALLQTLELHTPGHPSEQAASPIHAGPKPRPHPMLKRHPRLGPTPP